MRQISETAKITKSLVLNGNGAQNDNLFIITGSVEITDLWGVCTAVGNADVCTLSYFDLYDGTDTVEITDSGGTDLTDITVGSVIAKTAIATTALTLASSAIGAIIDGGSFTGFVFYPFAVIKKSTAATYIRFNFTGNADTNITMNFHMRYKLLSSDASVSAV